MKYEIIIDELNGSETIKRTDNGIITWIPTDPANSDYQRYLRHLAGEDESGTLS